MYRAEGGCLLISSRTFSGSSILASDNQSSVQVSRRIIFQPLSPGGVLQRLESLGADRDRQLRDSPAGVLSEHGPHRDQPNRRHTILADGDIFSLEGRVDQRTQIALALVRFSEIMSSR